MASKIFDLDMIKQFYAALPTRVAEARAKVGRPLTLTEKILFSHLHADSPLADYGRNKDYVFFAPDRDAVDSCCKRHDDCYQRYGPCKYCDDLFLDCLRPKINRQTNMGRDAALFYNVMRLRSAFK